ncbi:hypothetical protein DE146DRAFT_755879 [Phaeosphaeria sp. MPI-PUGE-AT-0046c]|nr:hypothetical protein DE146DRAFT_755879 [Phaeosphaeria sp. MPI-PUGE-AT-0046c]
MVMKRQSIVDDHQEVSEKRSMTLILRHKPEQSSKDSRDMVIQRPAGDRSSGRSYAIDENAAKDLWKEIESAIDESTVWSEFEKTPFDFLPEGELEKILGKFAEREGYGGDRRQVISTLLSLHPFSLTAEDHSLLNFILDEEYPAIKLLFTVLYAKHDKPYEAMRLLLRKPFRDADLPIQWSNGKLKKDLQKHPFALLDGGSNELWSRSAIKDFQQKQWLFQAPVLTTDPEKMPGQFGQKILPFVQRDTRRSGGAFGVVYKYTIQPNHFFVNEKISSHYVVAVKELRKDNDGVARHWAKEVTALSKMNTLNQEHIVRFLTAFTRGKPEDKPDELEYYVVFEWADGGNLKDLWTHFPFPGRSAAFMKWIMKQLYGLSQALSAAHYLLDKDGFYRGESYRHGDLKPENILWFPWGRGDGDWGTLKICDWGEAKNHHQVTALRHATTTQFGTRRYEPPEVVVGESELSEATKDARSRLYDLWSMGCVMMECIIWLVYGLKEQKRFNKSNRGDHSLSEYFYEPLKEGNEVKMVVHGAVKRWLKYMMDDPFCRPGKTAVGDALDIVCKGLLVVQLPTGDVCQDEARNFQCASLVEMKKPFSPSSPNTMLALPQGASVRRVVNSTSSRTAAQDAPSTASLNVQEFSKGTGSFASELEIPRSGPGNDLLTISVTPADDISSLSYIKQFSEGLKRYRATDLKSRLQEIVEAQHDDQYWLPQGSPAPPPQESSGSHLSPASISINVVPDAKNAAMRQHDQGNYAHPELNRDHWKFEVDNDFAASVVSSRIHIQALSGAARSAPKLCGKCAVIHKSLWSQLFKEAFKTEELRHNSESKLCDLCCLFWQACVQNEATKWQVVNFERIDSNLKISGTKSPSISLFQDGAVSNAIALQIGFGELSEPAHPLHFDTIRAWIADCDENHTNPVCNPHMSDSTSRIPTRLIDVGVESESCVVLKITREDEDLKWIALSYRWGGQPHFSTTRENIKGHTKGMKLADLPAIFQDAITMTRGLGCRYLWIDAVCIIQGEDGDFATESKRMEDVYSGAYCVLAASYTNSFRLFDPRKSRASVPLGSERSQSGIIYACEMIDDFKAHVLDGPLSLRGWVLQEHALARRTIFFTEHQTYWECGHGVRCETMTKMYNQYDEAYQVNSVSAALLGDPEFPKILKPAEHGERILRFQELYQQYSRLELTAEYDRPAAIDGLQTRLLRAMNVDGGFGVLEDPKNPGLLRRSLMWHRSTETLKIIDFPEDREKVPSWSWMSVSGPIDYVKLPFFGYAWQDVQSPWSKAEEEHAGKVITAEACFLNIVDTIEVPGVDIRLDIPADFSHNKLLVTVLGIEKGEKDVKDRQHCVLVVEEMSKLDGAGRKQCKRVGAGVVEGKYLSEKRKTCFIV